MKYGIKVLFIMFFLICVGMVYSVLVVMFVVKNVVVEIKVDMFFLFFVKVVLFVKVSDDEGIRVSINIVFVEDLVWVMNGVGLKKVQVIVSYWEEYGFFKMVDDLKQVLGMGSVLVECNLVVLIL